MLFGKEKEGLKQKIKLLESTLEFNSIQMQVLSIMQTMEILIDFNVIDEEKLLDYGFYHLEAIINFVAKNKFGLLGFKINPEKLEEFIKEFYEISSILLKMAKHEILPKDSSRYIIPAIKKIEIYASPSSEYNYNLSEFDKSR